jgi:hypothetical protein
LRPLSREPPNAATNTAADDCILPLNKIPQIELSCQRENGSTPVLIAGADAASIAWLAVAGLALTLSLQRFVAGT